MGAGGSVDPPAGGGPSNGRPPRLYALAVVEGGRRTAAAPAGSTSTMTGRWSIHQRSCWVENAGRAARTAIIAARPQCRKGGFATRLTRQEGVGRKRHRMRTGRDGATLLRSPTELPFTSASSATPYRQKASRRRPHRQLGLQSCPLLVAQMDRGAHLGLDQPLSSAGTRLQVTLARRPLRPSAMIPRSGASLETSRKGSKASTLLTRLCNLPIAER